MVWQEKRRIRNKDLLLTALRVEILSHWAGQGGLVLSTPRCGHSDFHAVSCFDDVSCRKISQISPICIQKDLAILRTSISWLFVWILVFFFFFCRTVSILRARDPYKNVNEPLSKGTCFSVNWRTGTSVLKYKCVKMYFERVLVGLGERWES